MIYPIVVYGHPVLRKVTEDIKKEDIPDMRQLIDDMFETMYASEGIGLAAPQIGKSTRLFVIDGDPVKEDAPEMAGFKKVFINARITERMAPNILMNEGCLSIPEMREEVARPSEIRMEYYDENGKFHNEIFKGFQARSIQHEYDHTEGILYVDRLSPLRKRLIRGKLNAIARGKFNVDYHTVIAKKKKDGN